VHGGVTNRAQHACIDNGTQGAEMRTMINPTRPQQHLRTLLATLALVAAAGALPSAHAGPGVGGHGMGGHEGRGGMMSLGGMERILDGLDASADQRAQIQQIVQQARDDLRGQHESGRALQQQMMQLFTQPTVDARSAEALRQQQLQQHDRASQRMMQAMLEVSRVLTPAQRQQLADRMTKRRALMERHRGERDQLERRGS